MVESAPNAMVMISQRGVIEMVNAQAERVFGFAREEMLGQPIEMLVPGALSRQSSRPARHRSFTIRSPGRWAPAAISTA